ncbi:MAG TPA: hypothetical protein VMS99_14310 [Acidimicrobiia bacterium]|nr:hypothetical protein [Acidimicrobiia bacterium]
MNLSELVTRARFEARQFLSPYPSIFLPLMRRRPSHDGKVIDADTEIVIEGYPRSGNTFATAAFEMAQRRPVRIARHLHAPAQVIAGVERGVPVMVVVRRPEDAVVSEVIRHPGLTLGQALRHYASFHQHLDGYRSGFVVAPFEQVIGDFGTVIQEVNDHFGTDFAPFDHTAKNVEEVFRRVDEMDRHDIGRRADDPAATTARPTASREQAKEELRQRLSDPVLAPVLERALEAFEAFTDTTESERR